MSNPNVKVDLLDPHGARTVFNGSENARTNADDLIKKAGRPA